ncbi:MAG TPA: hypothetical protein PK629_06945 [Oscillospiraceae bacterium]|nr:hypothetical protein [Oscillospiraceae bacterium]HPF55281.1 hypothetical protein [Clostridiales bacterium]HPK34685.1 hypothetical protein [Oscillospiraceae bacterium]HPR74551.1 hypothetical protein [Oscillospiraceae bacterium]
MDDLTSQQKKDRKILYIILIWVGVIVVSLAAIMLTTKSGNKNVKQIDLQWNQIQFGETVEANFIWEDLTDIDTPEELEAIIGVSPSIEASLFNNFSIGGIRKYTPFDETGYQLPDLTSVGVQFVDNSDETRTVLSIVSKTDGLTLQFPNSEYNSDLRNNDEAWTIIDDDNRCKLYKIYADGMVSQYSYAIFEKDGHFWHIEFTNMTDDEIAQIIYYAMQ